VFRRFVVCDIILLFPLGATVLEPNLHLEIQGNIVLINLSSDPFTEKINFKNCCLNPVLILRI